MGRGSPNSESGRRLTRRQLLGGGLLGLGVASAGVVVGAEWLHHPNRLPSIPMDIERPTAFARQPSWVQDFSSMGRTTIDTSVWRYETDPEVPGFNDELQIYTSSTDNVRIEAGIGLVLEAHKRKFDYTSGRIDTLGSFSFEFGKLEGRLRMPQGSGVWPAFWLLSENDVHTAGRNFSPDQYLDDRFYLRNGEIDIVEHYGDEPGVVEATAHTYRDSIAAKVDVDTISSVHTYGVELTPTTIAWTVDDVAYHEYRKPSEDPMVWPWGNGNLQYIILNLALGGPAGSLDDSKAPWRFEIESLRFFDYTGSS